MVTKIRQFRLDANIKQTVLAKMLGIAQPTLAYIEKNGIKRVSTAQKYAKILQTNAISILEIY